MDKAKSGDEAYTPTGNRFTIHSFFGKDQVELDSYEKARKKNPKGIVCATSKDGRFCQDCEDLQFHQK